MFLFYLKQAEGWIEEKLKVTHQASLSSVMDLQDKMRQLKKHQAFEAEIHANTERVEGIKKVCIYGRVDVISCMTQVNIASHVVANNILIVGIIVQFDFFCNILRAIPEIIVWGWQTINSFP